MSVRDQLRAFGVRKLLDYRSRPAAIRSALAGPRYLRAAPPMRDRVTLGVVQMHLDLVDDGPAFAERQCALVRQAVEKGAQLIVFPEYSWLPILGLLPPVRELAGKGLSLEGAVQELAPGTGLTLESVLRTIAPAVPRIMQTTARELAARFGVYLMPGSALEMDTAGKLYNIAHLFGPGGALIGSQKKLHATSLEVGWLTCGRELAVFQLPFATVTMPICMDYTYWETTREASERGAEILLGCSAEADANQFYMAMRGVPTRVQETMAFGCDAFCVTDLFQLNFRGPSYVVAPIGLTTRDTTFLAKAPSDDREEVLVTELDLKRLREFRAAHALESNRALVSRYLPRLYDEYRERVEQVGKRIVC